MFFGRKWKFSKFYKKKVNPNIYKITILSHFNEQIIRYVKLLLDLQNNNYHRFLGKTQNFISIFKWELEKIDLIELAYILHENRIITKIYGQIRLFELVEFLSMILNVDISDTHGGIRTLRGKMKKSGVVGATFREIINKMNYN